MRAMTTWSRASSSSAGEVLSAPTAPTRSGWVASMRCRALAT